MWKIVMTLFLVREYITHTLVEPKLRNGDSIVVLSELMCFFLPVIGCVAWMVMRHLKKVKEKRGHEEYDRLLLPSVENVDDDEEDNNDIKLMMEDLPKYV